MNSKRGWMRILEATIAVLVVLVVMVTIYLNQGGGGVNYADPFGDLRSGILEEISRNDTLRSLVLAGDQPKIEEFADRKLSEDYNVSVLICDISLDCDLGQSDLDYIYPRELYISEVMIFTDGSNYNPKRVKMFVWEK